MAPRPTCSAVVLLGLSRIPVRVYPATMEPPRVSFATICAKHRVKAKQQYTCSANGELLEKEDLSKAYEMGKDRFLPLTAEELATIQPEPNPEITILGVVELVDVVPLQWSGSGNYLGPDVVPGPVMDVATVRAYAQLVAALRDASSEDGVVALGRWSTRGTDKLVAIYRWDRRLVMQGLRRAGEIRDIAEIDAAEPADPGELEPVLSRLMLDHLDAAAWPDERYDATVRLLREKAAQAAEAPRKVPRRARATR